MFTTLKLIFILCVCSLVGSIAGKLMGSKRGFLGNAMVGLGGGFLGWAISLITGGHNGIIMCIIGACILTLILGRGK